MLGLSDQTVAVVVYAERNEGADVRLITARKANRSERALHYGEVFGDGY
jgi:uncharacterized DUF497 family protein